MAIIGCIAKLLGACHYKPNHWVRAVNPDWYQARHVPVTYLQEKKPPTQEELDKQKPAKKVVRPLQRPF